MSTDRGSFEPHKPCSCVDCALARGDQAEDALEVENSRLRAEAIGLRAMVDRAKLIIKSDADFIREEEREACAQVAVAAVPSVGWVIAAAIRARGEK